MAKAKLTLYVDEEISKLAHKTARISGRSISSLVKDFFLKKGQTAQSLEISPSVASMTGILRTSKSYAELRDDMARARLSDYEDTR